ncbi:hypothetical protein [Companilactobacillus kimchii]|uniref:Tropomyosin n=2 Tax=Companilactobacillus kimchii TaxID=2801452 RepID=A0ABR5NQL7_9LACO|nr:hypothetical protein [Companilactobacillus kimchii]KAE9562913.1 hypothetical protein ATN91_01750 [Companilactobacillus kimchii]KRK49948.1 hypothetical protein FC97_GL002332 [Companilactobacillus kimchii DSM 13961 = JCM 10707]OWF33081.1 hypothetical protein LKACC12383_01146 [Companilactobacillus kimchii]GEO46834.1 hypothetical protein LKI01_08330 [Companilactobacillus paralimentarius]
MKFFTGFVVGTISGIALHLVQSKDALSSVNDTKIFQNIKDFKDILTDLQKNTAVVPEVVSGIQEDLSNYSESIKPDVEELQESIAEMKSNLDELNKG